MKVYIKYEDLGTKGLIYQAIEQSGLEVMMEDFKELVIKSLKPLESDIDNEGGIIILKEDGTVNPEGFSKELHLKINMLLSEAFKN